MLYSEEISIFDQEIEENFKMTLEEFKASKDVDREAKLQQLDPRERSILIRMAKYYRNNAEARKEYSRNYNARNKKRKKEYISEWRKNNSEHIRSYNSAWRETNKERKRKYDKQYYLEHREEILARRRKKSKNKNISEEFFQPCGLIMSGGDTHASPCTVSFSNLQKASP